MAAALSIGPRTTPLVPVAVAPAAPETELELEIAHVLFVDIVGYSKLLINEQHEALGELNRIVRGAEAFRAAEEADKLIRLPTGDGMALAFATSPDAPVRCAVQISKALRAHPALQVRMGVHSGPVSGLTDVNDRSNVAGAGINFAQRVMDCGDAGHILLSQRVAEDLAQYRSWQPLLHHLGPCVVKHGEVISLVSLHGADVGNSALPARIEARRRIEPRLTRMALALFIAVASGAIAWTLLHQPTPTSANASDASRTAETLPAAPEKSVAVLPFENLSANPDTAFFTDGVQDEILSNLAKVSDLKVISRTSVMQYKTGRVRNLREIGQRLGVANILEGSVQRSGNRVRINAQLIDARTDAHLWAQSYDRDLADVFAIQTEIAKTIADQLRAKISPGEAEAIARPPTTDVVAERLYVQARELAAAGSNPDGKSALLQATKLLDEAISRDPRFLSAYALLVTVHLDLYWQGFDHTEARRELARAALERATQYKPDAGEVHLAHANYIYQGFRDYAGARADLELAEKTMPNNGGVHVFKGSVARRQGRWREANENFQRALELDPLNFRFLIEAAFTFQAQRQFAQAREMYERALKILPRDSFVRVQLAEIAFDEQGNPEPLRAELAAVLDQDPNAATEVANALFRVALAGHDPALMTRALQAIRPEGLRDLMNNSLWAREWFVGLAAHTLGDTRSAQTAFTAARVIEEKNVQEQPKYAPAWSRLGLIDAALGRKEDALREGRRACELLPVSADAMDGAALALNLAKIYAWTGEKDLAIEQLNVVAKIPSSVTYGDLKLNPEWNSLRGDPRFDAIVSSLAPSVLKETKL
ncbi:MAG: hypothetical protein M3Y86_06770 [Verrucomicrobiota bacterium]|nr:hypothetical protein [Verrucomicrobiota bacterium]